MTSFFQFLNSSSFNLPYILAIYYGQLLFNHRLVDRHISKLSVIASSMSPSVYALSLMYCAYDCGAEGGTTVVKTSELLIMKTYTLHISCFVLASINPKLKR